MIKKFLKIAGVKNEQEFYKKYPSEATFFKAHPDAKDLKKYKKGGEMKKLNQLTNFTNDVDGLIPMAQVGIEQPGGFNFYDAMGSQYYNITGAPYNAQTYTMDPNQTGTSQQLGLNDSPLGSIPTPQTTAQTTTVAAAKDSVLDRLGGYSGIAQSAGELIGGIQQIGDERKQMKRARMFKDVSGVVAQAASTRPEQTKRKYVRPEDVPFQPEQLSPTYGTGTNYLQLQDGGEVTGSIYDGDGEIQNMYFPGDLYMDLGYEPMNDSQVKMYQSGGGIPKAQFGQIGNVLGSAIGGAGFTNTGAGRVGSALGQTIGDIIPIPGAGAILGGVGGLVGGLIGSGTARKTKKYNEQMLGNVQQAALQSGAQAIQNQYSANMKNGGWVSNDWQPQLITHFGDLTADEVNKYASEGMDTLRTGGNIRQNQMFATDNLAMGGDIVTRWGGNAQPMSYNPFLPDGGETVMFRGQSHEEADGKGRTGIGVSYGGNPDNGYMGYAEYGTEEATDMAHVEVERNEPAIKLPDAETGDSSLVVYGNLKIPKALAHEIGDSVSNIKNKTFKKYVEELSKDENKQNKILDKAGEQASEADEFTSFGSLKLSSAKAKMIGASMKLKQNAQRKINAAAVQNALNETAEELGINPDALAKGKIKQAKGGANIPKAQGGNLVDWLASNKRPTSFQERKKLAEASGIANYTGTAAQNQDLLKKLQEGQGGQGRKKPERFEKVMQARKPELSLIRSPELEAEFAEAKRRSQLPPLPPRFNRTLDNAQTVANAVLPFVRPSNMRDLDPTQLAGEMAAISMNPLEAVQAQTFTPDLQSYYDISLQDQLNEITANQRAAQRSVRGNASAEAMIAAQSNAAKSKVLGDQTRMNQANRADVIARNLQTLNQSRAANLQLLDQQYARQAEARSKTKATALEAIKSVSDKVMKNKLENNTLATYENMYNYRFDPRFRAINMNPLAQFNVSQVGNLIPVYDNNGNVIEYRKPEEKTATSSKTKTAKNGSIVKGLKNI